MAIASFVSSTTISTRNPSLFIQSPNRKTNHYLLLAIPSPYKPLALRRHPRPPQALALRCSSVAAPPLPPLKLLSESTRTIFSIISLALSAFRRVFSLAASVAAPTPTELAEIKSLRSCLSCAIGPLFFAALRNRPSGYLNTPLTVVASGMGKWLDIYSGVLLVRVLLSWFPNIPWDRQPLSAIRDLCDPYLNLFRNIIPPIFDTLDVSPLLAFAVLGVLGSILKSAVGVD